MAEIAIAAAVAAAVAAASYSVSYLLTEKPKPVERGRLQGQLQVQDSSYGSRVPGIYGGPASAAVTATAATDVLNATAHPFVNGEPVSFETTTTLPAPLLLHGTYWVRDVTANTFKVSETKGGAAVDITDAGSGTHTATSASPHGIRVAGNVIFLSDIRPVEKIVSGSGGGGSGKGGGGAPKERQITYYVDVAICFGQPGKDAELELLALFAGSDLIYDVRPAIINAVPATGGCPPGMHPDPDTGVCVINRPRVRPGTGVLDPAFPADTSYSYLTPPGPYNADLLDRPDERFGYYPIPNARNEISATIVNGGYAALRFYPGNETQEVDPLITAEFQKLYAADYALGRDVTPAYRDRSYVVLQDFNISKYGTVPNFTAILRNKNLRSASQILSSLCTASGLNVTTEVDVTALASSMVRGVAIMNRMSVKEFSADTLARRFPFDWTQKNGKLTAVMRGGAAVYDVPASHLGWKPKGTGDGNEGASRVAVKQRMNEAEMPRRIEVKAFDPTRDFEISTGSAKRQVVTSKVEKVIEVNMALLQAEMDLIAERELEIAWLEDRQALAVSLPHTYAGVVPTDVLSINDGGSPTAIVHTMRIKEITGPIPGAQEIIGVPTDSALYVSNAITPPTAVIGTVLIPATVVGSFIDSRYLRDREANSGQAGYYVACTSLGNGEFRGAQLWRERQGVYEYVCDFTVKATMGRAASVLSDTATYVDVDLYGTTEMESYSADAVLWGAGWIYVGRESLQYTTATPQAGFTNRWRLSGLTSRGTRGTEEFTNDHVANERFVLLNEAVRFVATDLTEVDVARNHKFLALGMALDDVAPVSYTWAANAFRPAKVTNISLAKDGNNDRLIQFVGHPTPAEEPAEYAVEIWTSEDRTNITNRKRTLPANTNTTHACLLDSSGTAIHTDDGADTFTGFYTAHADKNNFIAGLGTKYAQTLETLQQTYTRFDFTIRVPNASAVGVNPQLVEASLEQSTTFSPDTRAPVRATAPVHIQWSSADGANIVETIRSANATVGTPRTFVWGASGVSVRYTILLSGTEYRIYANYTPGAGQVPLAIVAAPGSGFPFPLRLKMSLTDFGTGPFYIDNIVAGGNLFPTTIYANRDQVKDFGVVQNTLYLRVYQKSRFAGIANGLPVDVVLQDLADLLYNPSPQLILSDPITGDRLHDASILFDPANRYILRNQATQATLINA